MMILSKVLAKNQITIPKEVREQLGIQEGDQVTFTEFNGVYVFRKLDESKMREFLLIDTPEKYIVNKEGEDK